jgi:hypothetical protein
LNGKRFGAVAVELKLGLDEVELELLRLRADRHPNSDRRRGDLEFRPQYARPAVDVVLNDVRSTLTNRRHPTQTSSAKSAKSGPTEGYHSITC